MTSCTHLPALMGSSKSDNSACYSNRPMIWYYWAKICFRGKRKDIPNPSNSENIKQCGVNTCRGLAMGIFWLWPRLQIINYVSERLWWPVFFRKKSDIIHGALWQQSRTKLCGQEITDRCLLVLIWSVSKLAARSTILLSTAPQLCNFSKDVFKYKRPN